MIKTFITALIFSLIVPNAYAHKNATGIVKERMDAMSSISASAKAISLMLKGKSDYKTKSIANASQNISKHAQAFLKMFPEGSTDAPSEAAPAIWQRSNEFSKQAQDLVNFTNILTKLANADSDQASINDAFGKVKSTCKSCHSDFRIKK